MFKDFETHKDNIACISSSGRQMTYGELDTLARRIAACLEPHQLVLALCSRTIGAVAGYVAFLRNDNAVLLVDSQISRASLESLMKVYRPRYIWDVDDDVDGDGDGDERGRRILKAEGYVLWETREKGPAVHDRLALLLPTSGSTGSPKLVRLSKENLRANTASVIEYLHITERERPVLAMPMHYAFGLSVINTHLTAGATLLLTEASFAEFDFWKFANENGFTSFSGIPYAYETIKKFGIWKQDMPTLRTLTQAGGAMNKELLMFFHETFGQRGVKFYAMYGQTEATARMAYLEPDCIAAKAGSIGKAIPGGEFWLEDESGEVITSPGVTGELIYKGANAGWGYAEEASDLLKGDENGGVIHTGDMAYRDADGFYFITGRKGRFVKLFGVRLSLDHIETLLQPLLTDGVCVGDDKHIVIFTTDKSGDWNGVADYLSQRTKVPRKVFSVCHINEIPRSEGGKVLYHELWRLLSKEK